MWLLLQGRIGRLLMIILNLRICIDKDFRTMMKKYLHVLSDSSQQVFTLAKLMSKVK